MVSGGLVLPWVLLLSVMDGGVSGCECPQATILAQFPSEAPPESCCLNYSGSTFGSVTWALFSNVTALEVLDLTDCNITHIQGAAALPAQLSELYLGRNALTALPERFLANAPGLRVLDLGGNFLERVPGDFLRSTSRLRELRLDSNRLSALPRGVFKPSLERLELSGNPWDCACPLVEELQGLGRRLGHRGNDSSWQGTVGNVTCASPVDLAGRSAWSVRTADVCQIPGLTVLFILLPLLLLLALALCWCCGRKRKRKEGSFRPAKWDPEPGAAGAHRNGSEHDRRQGHPNPARRAGRAAGTCS
ncbi:hypothetical protein AAFF_G00304460 [Aldrovandia affinis]|uniref:LRRCT domain-containing protein n=1 Tax=Aldrovandia affinis TaxID=143900 RepID=A0AAD7WRD3_9TELE|nr:hypothetical protein AAFF_G00304460 [Aldrovandia affinis]